MIQVDDGYSIVHNVFDQRAMLDVVETLDRTPLQRTKAGARHILAVSSVRNLATDPRMLSLARAVVGGGAVPFRATLFDKSPDANWLVAWHQDTALPLKRRVEEPGWGPWSTKAGVLFAHAPAWALARVVALRVHLDSSALANGPLRVIPGSQELGVLTDEQLGTLASSQEIHACLVPAGGGGPPATPQLW